MQQNECKYAVGEEWRSYISRGFPILILQFIVIIHSPPPTPKVLTLSPVVIITETGVSMTIFLFFPSAY